MTKPTAFKSILYHNNEPTPADSTTQPAYFIDLNLDQIVSSITKFKEEYSLNPYFYLPLKDEQAVYYRQHVIQELANEELLGQFKAFAKNMRALRDYLPKPDRHYYNYQKERLFLDAVSMYCQGVSTLAHQLFVFELKAEGLLALREYLKTYTNGDHFSGLSQQTGQLLRDLSAIRYAVHTKGLDVQVLNYKSESNYSQEIEGIFERFRQEPGKDYLSKFEFTLDMNSVEARILEGVASLYPELFQSLLDYYAGNQNYLDDTIALFDREMQFYLSYLEYITPLQKKGLLFSFPSVSVSDKQEKCLNGFDLALAAKLVPSDTQVVTNDFYLEKQERIMIISGPNQGGKTTFARMFGQLHHLAALGFPVPGNEVKLFLFDRMFSHFEKEEEVGSHRSKLEEDLMRIHQILESATANSVIIMNEILSSTTLQDATFLSEKIMDEIISNDIICVWVTFIDELSHYSDKNVSMISTVNKENPAIRTFKVVRSPADGLAYAKSIAEKYKVTYKDIKKRIS